MKRTRWIAAAVVAVVAALGASVAVERGDDVNAGSPAQPSVNPSEPATRPRTDLGATPDEPAAAVSAAPIAKDPSKLKQRLEANRLEFEARSDVARRGELLRSAAKLDPTNETVLEKLTAYELDSENYSAARATAKRCLAARASNTNCAKYQRWAHMRDGKFTEGLKLADRCLQTQPGDTQCTLAKVQALTALRRLDEAEQALRSIPDAGVWGPMARAGIARMRGDIPGAIRLYEKTCTDVGNEAACTSAEKLRKQQKGQR